jgi:hypothetical protein
LYVRRIKVPGGGEGFNYQLVRSYREGRMVKKEVLVHLGPFSDTADALTRWRNACDELESSGRHTQAQKLKAKYDRLVELTNGESTWDPKHRWYRDGLGP